MRNRSDQQCGIAVLDDIFPHPLSAFRFEEFVSYLDELPNLNVYSNGWTFPMIGEKRSVEDLISAHISEFPHHTKRIHPLIGAELPDARAVYAIFLNNIHNYIDQIDWKRLPFAFTLYPGGGFALEQAESDRKLRRVFRSPWFRRVIVTQPITHDYLIAKQLCAPDRIAHIDGGVIPRSAFDPPDSKQRYGFGKPGVDICFVAARYTPTGADKGYDLFVEAAKALYALGTEVRFHVVGPYDHSVIDLGAAASRFHFYGFRERGFFRDFYRQMDLMLAPTRPYVLSPGAFDGFPTGACVEAGLQAVAVVCSDELRLNRTLKEGEDIVIVRPNAEDINAALAQLLADPARLAAIGENGRQQMSKVFGRDAQLTPRIEILRSLQTEL